MLLKHGQFQFGLSEREMAIVLEALEEAVERVPEGSAFDRDDFAEVAAEVAHRAAY